MRKCFAISLLAALALQLGACSGDDAFETPGAGGPGVDVSAVSVLVSSPQLLSDDSAPVDITVLVLNNLNQAIADVPVVIQASSGVLTDVEAVTGASGTAKAVLRNSSDLTNRQITVTASAGTATDTVVVDVTGTRLNVQSPTTIVLNDSIDAVVTLLDAGGQGIASEVVNVSSADGNGLSATSLTTDANGKATVTITGSVPGNDSITFTALGISATQNINVSNDNFSFAQPAEGAEIFLDNVATTGTVENLTVVRVDWSLNGTPQVNEDINFSTTRGTLYQHNGSACTTSLLTGAVQTNAQGQARVCIAATNAGPATITAITEDGTTSQRGIEFVATIANSINVQAEPTTVSINGQSIVTAVVRDPSGNLVKNKTVVFTIEDVTGGTLSAGSAVTDSNGRAQTTYTASSTTSAANGVEITAAVQGTAVSSFATLTVARQELFISLGTDNEIGDESPIYRKRYAIFVTDVDGRGVANAQLIVRVLSLWYATGERVYQTAIPEGWTITSFSDSADDLCIDEDLILGSGPGYRNGVLDDNEDFNQNGTLEAGNIAAVENATEGTDPGDPIVTNSAGKAEIDVVYPQEYAYWMKVELSALASVQGTESVRTVRFVLPGSSQDFDSADSNPPGLVSPFGDDTNYGCPIPPNFP
jgi:hypothetical protein